MSRWADYVVVGVRYSINRTHIASVKVYVDAGNLLTQRHELTRPEAINYILQGKEFVTATYDKTTRRYRKGAEVHLIEVSGLMFMRTDSNTTSTDNLGNLPEF